MEEDNDAYARRVRREDRHRVVLVVSMLAATVIVAALTLRLLGQLWGWW